MYVIPAIPKVLQPQANPSASPTRSQTRVFMWGTADEKCCVLLLNGTLKNGQTAQKVHQMYK
jgi:hypothetical protein